MHRCSDQYFCFYWEEVDNEVLSHYVQKIVGAVLGGRNPVPLCSLYQMLACIALDTMDKLC